MAVEGEQSDQGQGRGDPSGRDLSAHDAAQDLGDDGAGSKDGGQAGDGADDAQYQESGDGAEQGLEQSGEEGAEARAVDDTDQHGNECHEGEQGVDGGLDGVPCRLVEGGDDLACAQADLCEGVALAGLGHLLGQLLGGVDAALFLLCGGFCCGSSISDGSFGSVRGHDVGIGHAGDVDVFLDELGQGACLADGVDVDGGDALLGVEAAAEGAAAVDDDECQLIFGSAGLEAVDGLEAGGALVLKPLTGSRPVSSTILGRISGATPPPVMYMTLFFFSVPWMTRGPPKPPEPFSTRIALYSAILIFLHIGKRGAGPGCAASSTLCFHFLVMISFSPSRRGGDGAARCRAYKRWGWLCDRKGSSLQL